MNNFLAAVPCSSGDVAVTTSGSTATVAYAATSGFSHCITGVSWSYAPSAPVSGNLVIQDTPLSGQTVNVYQHQITSAGAGNVHFTLPKMGTQGSPMNVILGAASSGSLGQVSVHNHWITTQ